MAMAVVAHSPLLPAQTPSDSLSAMSWPIQQGESLSDIARLFYPKNKYMQQQFIAAAIRLNQETKPDFNASTAFINDGVIVIPSIKVLSKKSRHAPAQLLDKRDDSQVVEHPVISTKLIETYENLVHKNTFFKQELEHLNVKLAHLQQVLAQLKVDLTSIFVAYDNAAAVNSAKLSEAQRAKNTTIKPTTAIVKSADKPMKIADTKVVSSSNLWKSILTALLFSTLFVSSIWYSFWLLRKLGIVYKGKIKKHHSAEDDKLKPLDKDIFNDNFVLRHQLQQKPAIPSVQSLVELNKFSDSILQLGAAVMPLATKELNETEEGELMLAQARIYVNLERYDNAIRLLSAYIKVSPKAAWQHWLCLLDIYRKVDQKEAFLEAAKQLHQTFNVETPEWDAVSPIDNDKPANTAKHSLEEHDVIMDKVTKLWADCQNEANKITQTKGYLDALILDNRDSERSGFNMEVFEEIMLLRNVLDAREKLAKEV